MTKLFIIGLTVICLLLAASDVRAQNLTQEQAEPVTIDQALIKQDLSGAKFLLKLLPIENQTITTLKEAFPATYSKEDLESKLHRYEFFRTEGYTAIKITIITYDGQIAHYQAGIYNNGKHWDDVKNLLLSELQQKEVGFEQTKDSLVISGNILEIVNKYQQAFADKLGPLEPVEIPPAFQATYENLMSPFSMIEFNDDIDARRQYTVDFLAKTEGLTMDQRLRILTNIIKGYNSRSKSFACAISMNLAADDENFRVNFLNSLVRYEKALHESLNIYSNNETDNNSNNDQ